MVTARYKRCKRPPQPLPAPTSELLLDFSAVQRIDAKALIAIEELAERAEQAEVAVVFRGVNVKVYKVLKLVRLASKFSFVSFDN